MRDVESLQRDLDATLAARAAAASDYELPPIEAYCDEGASAPCTEAESASAPSSGITPYAATRLADMTDEPRETIVQRLFEAATVAAVAGPPNAGKTALAVDLAVHLAVRAATWFGLKTSGGPVVYFAAEAPGSVIMRAKACADQKFYGTALPLYIVSEPPLLGGEQTSDIAAARMIATIEAVASAEGAAVKVAFLDTLAAALGDGDENGEGMLRTVAAAKAVALATGAAVIIVHHPSKGDANGLRGHGSLAAACDTILVISVHDLSGQRTATLTKSRDFATGMQITYELEMVGLAKPDQFGDARTTIIVRPLTGPALRKPRPVGKAQEALLAELERQYRTGQTSWAEAAISAAGRTIGQHRNSAANALRGLLKAGYLRGTSADLRLAFPPEANEPRT